MAGNRYGHLLDIIRAVKPRVIVEVGTHDGTQAINMATEALKHSKEVWYVGFDLYGDATAETDAAELNVKKHAFLDEVGKKLQEFQGKNSGFSFELIQGNSRETVPNWVQNHKDMVPDIAFIDGGHSLETIKSDYDALSHSRVVILDDYYEKDEKGACPDLTKFGCNKLVEAFTGDYAILPMKDQVRGGGFVRMVTIGKLQFAKMQTKIKTMNCVRDEKLRGNIRYACEVMDPYKFMRQCLPHEKVAVMVGAGPSLPTYYDQILQHQKLGHYVFCVKSTHDRLIEQGIIPYGCILLDPRTDTMPWLQKLHKDVIYFTATMCHPQVVEYIADAAIADGIKYVGYNALVGAGEEKVLEDVLRSWAAKKVTPDFFPFMISGGSTAALRGLSVLHTMGFRNFHLYGYDSCWFEKADMSLKTKTGKPRFVEAEIYGKKFVSDGQMLAQAQDFGTLLNVMQDVSIKVYGDGILAHILQNHQKQKPVIATFDSVAQAAEHKHAQPSDGKPDPGASKSG